MKERLFISLVIVVGCAVGGRGQALPLRLQVGGGLVTLHAENVPVRTILTEWARLGGARIVNGDRVAGAPVTLDLERVPERQALDIILRGVSGYMLATRETGAIGTSMFDRIVILPTSVAPPTPPSAFAPTASGAQPVRVLVPSVQAADQPDPVTGIIGAIDDPSQGAPIARPAAAIPPRGSIGMPVSPPVVAPPITGVVPTTQAPAPSTPSNPFGVPAGSSARPGEIATAPPPPGGYKTPDPNR